MKNLAKLVGIIAFVAVIGFLVIACDDGDGGLIDGSWDRGDIVVTFNGSSGVFTEISSNSGWYSLLNNGTVSIGDRKFRNITYKNNSTWSGQELTYQGYSTTWEDTTITISGSTLKTDTPNASPSTNTYTRK